MFEIQQKAIRTQEDMASAMRMRPASSASAPNLPGLAGGSARQAGAEADARCTYPLGGHGRRTSPGGGCLLAWL